MPAPNEIPPAQLLRLIGTPDCPAIIDVTLDEDFDADPFLIPGPRRHSHTDPAGLPDVLDSQRAVVVCQKGKKLSHGMAAWLNNKGCQAEYLSGGNYGWRGLDGAVRLPAGEIPQPVDGATLWVTRHRPKIDRIACPWLIRRFIDPKARFLFVSPDAVEAVAEKFAGTPFDIAEARFSHRGDGCTFDALLEDFNLSLPALRTMAEVIRAADTNRPGNHPVAPGLLALSVGLSRQFRDDTAQLDAGLTLYDALFRWARDGQGETHDTDFAKG